jgi:hypothetical protein
VPSFCSTLTRKGWEKIGNIWCLGDEACIQKIDGRWYAQVMPRLNFHLGPFPYLDKAMRAVSEYIRQRDSIPNLR